MTAGMKGDHQRSDTRYDWSFAPPGARYAVTNSSGFVEWWAEKPWVGSCGLWTDQGHDGRCHGLVAGPCSSAHPVLDPSGWQNSLEAKVDEGFDAEGYDRSRFRAREALRDHDQEEGSGAFWGSSPKSGGPDWTGFDG